MSVYYPLQVWDGPNFTGNTVTFAYGLYPDVSKAGVALDSIQSVRVGAFTQVQLFRSLGFAGYFTTIMGTQNIPDLNVFESGAGSSTRSIQVTRVVATNQTIMNCCAGVNPADRCGEYTPGSGSCAGKLSSYCRGTNTMLPECKDYCAANPMECDESMMMYCGGKPTDPACSCLTSPAARLGLNPYCTDAKCQATGYAPASMKAKSCATADCDTRDKLATYGVALATAYATLTCNAPAPLPVISAAPQITATRDLVAAPPTVAPITPIPSTASTVTGGASQVSSAPAPAPAPMPAPAAPAEAAGGGMSAMVWIFMLLIIFVVIAGVVMAMKMRPKTGAYDDYTVPY